MKNITVFDTSVATDNVGDDIIMDAVLLELMDVFPDGFFTRLPTHDYIGKMGRRIAKKAEMSFVGGSNILCPNAFYHNQWKLHAYDFWKIGHPLLLGVGWQRYTKSPDPLTALVFWHLFKNKYSHSVRDEYTRQKLIQMGISNVVNTGCPTMWRLTPEHCAAIPKEKAPHAIITVTGYAKSQEVDRRWIEAVCKEYDKVYFWPQMYDDAAYLASIADPARFVILGSSLSKYNDVLRAEDVDHIGTRLHGGIRALQYKRRSLILQIDNRATEIAKDTNLPTVPRSDIEGLGQKIKNSIATSITMPFAKISAWKNQFSVKM